MAGTLLQVGPLAAEHSQLLTAGRWLAVVLLAALPKREPVEAVEALLSRSCPAPAVGRRYLRPGPAEARQSSRLLRKVAGLAAASQAPPS